MAEHIKIEVVPNRDTAEELAKSFASALAKAAGWVLDTDEITVWTSPSHTLGVRFLLSGTDIYPAVVNSGGTSGNFVQVSAVFGFPPYRIYYVKTEAGTVAFGLGFGNDIIPSLTVVVGKNDSGIWSGIVMASENNTSAPPAARTTTLASEKKFSVPVNYGLDRPVSLVRLPDMINGGMFVDIYAVMSTPTGAVSSLFKINDRYFRPIKMNNSNTTTMPMLAVPTE